jgi:hypothetical protein
LGGNISTHSEGIRADAYAAEVESVGIPAGCNGWIIVPPSIAMTMAGGDQ